MTKFESSWYRCWGSVGALITVIVLFLIALGSMRSLYVWIQEPISPFGPPVTEHTVYEQQWICVNDGEMTGFLQAGAAFSECLTTKPVGNSNKKGEVR